jgi:general secretion pathway protein L
MSAVATPGLPLHAAGLGLRGFLAWWGAALASWLPPAWRRALIAASERLLLQPAGDDLQLRLQAADGVRDVANLPVPPARADGGDPLHGLLADAALGTPRWLLLPAASGLRRSLPLPAAARERLRDVLAFEIERQTPFAAADVHYDGRVLDVREDGQLLAELVVVPRARLDAALARLGPLAGWLEGVDLVDADGRPLGVNLLPPAQRLARANPWRLWNLVLTLLALLALALGLAQILENRQTAADQLQREVAQRSEQARAVSLQRQRLVDAVEGNAYLQERRNARPSVVELADELARRLPDGTYLEKLAIDGEQLTLIGLSNQAAALVGRLEGASQWRAPALSGPLQPDPRTRGDRFTLVAQLNEAQPLPEAPRAPR